MLRERAIAIGSPVPLAAVITEPEQFDPQRPALLVLNSGVMHHVGSCRLSVEIARAAAARGLLALRFDFSGIGDSSPRGGSASTETLAMQELTEVMDYLQRVRGVQRFITFGLCSGAHNGYKIACRDERVIGVVQIDGYCYTTWRYHLEHYRPLLFKWQHWASFLSRQFLRLTGRYKPKTASESAGIDARYLEVPTFDPTPPRSDTSKNLQTLMARGVALYAIFTGGEPRYNYHNQYRDIFRDVDFDDRLTLDYYPKTSHIITQPQYQRAIIDSVSDWLAAR